MQSPKWSRSTDGLLARMQTTHLTFPTQSRADSRPRTLRIGHPRHPVACPAHMDPHLRDMVLQWYQLYLHTSAISSSPRTKSKHCLTSLSLPLALILRPVPAPLVMSALPTNVHVSKHPCLRAKLSQLRSKSMNARETKDVVHEISLILATEALASLEVVTAGTVRRCLS